MCVPLRVGEDARRAELDEVVVGAAQFAVRRDEVLALAGAGQGECHDYCSRGGQDGVGVEAGICGVEAEGDCGPVEGVGARGRRCRCVG